MAAEKRSLRLEDIPVMNLGRYLLDKMKNFQDMYAVVRMSFRFMQFKKFCFLQSFFSKVWHSVHHIQDPTRFVIFLFIFF